MTTSQSRTESSGTEGPRGGCTTAARDRGGDPNTTRDTAPRDRRTAQSAQDES